MQPQDLQLAQAWARVQTWHRPYPELLGVLWQSSSKSKLRNTDANLLGQHMCSAFLLPTREHLVLGEGGMSSPGSPCYVSCVCFGWNAVIRERPMLEAPGSYSPSEEISSLWNTLAGVKPACLYEVICCNGNNPCLFSPQRWFWSIVLSWRRKQRNKYSEWLNL